MKRFNTNILQFLSIIIMLTGLSSVNLFAGEKVEAEGEITALTASSITVDDTDFEVNLLTKVYTKSGVLNDFSILSLGQNVKVVGEVVADVNISKKIVLLDEDESEDSLEIEVKGELTALSETSLTVDGTDFTLNSETRVFLDGEGEVDFSYLSIGQQLEVKGYISGEENIASLIKIENDDNGDDDSTETELEVKGEITELSETSLTVDGTSFDINSDTEVMTDEEELVDISALEVGLTVEVKGYASGELNIATLIKIENEDYGDDDSTNSELEVVGEITELSKTSLTVDETSFEINSDTKILNDEEELVDISALEVGLTVEVKGYTSGDVNIATYIKIENEGDDDDDEDSKTELEVKGEITALSDSTLTVRNSTFIVNAETEVMNDNEEIVDFNTLEVGQTVEVKGYVSEDVKIASLIKIEDENDDEKNKLEVHGDITALTETSLTVDSTTFTLNNQTKVLIEGSGYADLNYLALGLQVEVKGYRTGEENIARLIKVENEDDDSSDVVFEEKGEITALTETSITVNDVNFTINSETLVFMKGKANVSDLQLGQIVEVKAYTLNGENFAMLIKIEMEDDKGVDIETEGELSELSEGMLSVNGMTFTLNSQTLVVLEETGKVDISNLEVGQTIEIKAYISGGDNIAKIIKIKQEDKYTITVNGEITEKDSNSLMVNDTKFYVYSETQFFGADDTELTFDDFSTGMFVKIKANSIDSVNIALKVYLKENEGVQEEENEVNFVEEETLVVGDQIYNVDSETEVYNNNGLLMSYFELQVGMEVEVIENIEGGTLFASKIQILNNASIVETKAENGTMMIMNYPNPFEHKTMLKFNLTEEANVQLDIFDITGTKVHNVYEGELNSGDHDFEIFMDGKLGAGIYYARLVINGQVYSNIMVKQ